MPRDVLADVLPSLHVVESATPHDASCDALRELACRRRHVVADRLPRRCHAPHPPCSRCSPGPCRARLRLLPATRARPLCRPAKPTPRRHTSEVRSRRRRLRGRAVVRSLGDRDHLRSASRRPVVTTRGGVSLRRPCGAVASPRPTDLRPLRRPPLAGDLRVVGSVAPAQRAAARRGLPRVDPHGHALVSVRRSVAGPAQPLDLASPWVGAGGVASVGRPPCQGGCCASAPFYAPLRGHAAQRQGVAPLAARPVGRSALRLVGTVCPGGRPAPLARRFVGLPRASDGFHPASPAPLSRPARRP